MMLEVGKRYRLSETEYVCLLIRGDQFVMERDDGVLILTRNTGYYHEIKPKHKVKIRMYRSISGYWYVTGNTINDFDNLFFSLRPYTEIEVEIEEP